MESRALSLGGPPLPPIPDGERGGRGLRWGRGLGGKLVLGKEPNAVGTREESGEPGTGLAIDRRSQREWGGLGCGEREGT